MQSSLVSFSAGALLLTTAAIAPAQSIVNGSFELGLNPGSSIELPAGDNTSITGWEVFSGTICYVGTLWNAGAGVRSIDLSGMTAGTLRQEVTGLTLGQEYQFSFLMAGNPDPDGQVAPMRGLRAFVGQNVHDFSFDVTGRTPTDMGWSERTVNFVADSASLTVAFASFSPNPYGPAIDNVRLTPVPEPRLMLGLALLGGVWFLRCGARRSR